MAAVDSGMSNADGGGAENGFFGDISSSVTRTFDQLLPIWASSKIQQQSKDQLNQTTFNPVTAAPRVNDGMGSTTQSLSRTALAKPMNTVIVVGGLLLAVGVVFYLAKR